MSLDLNKKRALRESLAFVNSMNDARPKFKFLWFIDKVGDVVGCLLRAAVV